MARAPGHEPPRRGRSQTVRRAAVKAAKVWRPPWILGLGPKIPKERMGPLLAPVATRPVSELA